VALSSGMLMQRCSCLLLHMRSGATRRWRSIGADEAISAEDNASGALRGRSWRSVPARRHSTSRAEARPGAKRQINKALWECDAYYRAHSCFGSRRNTLTR
jgi:hypothetical protein